MTLKTARETIKRKFKVGPKEGHIAFLQACDYVEDRERLSHWYYYKFNGY